MKKVLEHTKDFLFGKVKSYRIQTDLGTFDIGGRYYEFDKDGFIVVYGCFAKVATFTNAKYIAIL